MTNKEALKNAQELIQFCHSHDYCTDCIFYEGDDIINCAINYPIAYAGVEYRDFICSECQKDADECKSSCEYGKAVRTNDK